MENTSQSSNLLQNFLTIVLKGMMLKEKIGFKQAMQNHPCYCGDEGDEVYMLFDSPDEKEETIEYLTKSLKKKGVKTQIKRCT